MPLPGTAKGMGRQGKRQRRSWRDLEEEGGIERCRDWKIKGWRQFLALVYLVVYAGCRWKRPAGIAHCWSSLRLTNAFLFTFYFSQITRREREWNFSILLLFRLYQSPKRRMKSWSLSFHDNNHLDTAHIKVNQGYMSRQINLCQPLLTAQILCWSAYHWCPESKNKSLVNGSCFQCELQFSSICNRPVFESICRCIINCNFFRKHCHF